MKFNTITFFKDLLNLTPHNFTLTKGMAKMKKTILWSILLITAVAQAQLAKGAPKFLGNITTNGAVRSDFGTYWDQITAENECKWGSIEWTRGSYNFAGCDAAYNWAKDHGGHFKFHALVWGAQYPNWLEGLDVNETKTAITAWFDAVAAHYPDMEMIDVVNEAIRTSNGQYHSGYTKTKIIEALGGDNNGDYTFVTTAFKMARERWPNAILIYNDYNTFSWQIDEGIALVNQIKSAGAPVDAYGQQAHDLTNMDVNAFKAALKKIHDGVGIPLFITEYDIGTDDDALQLQRYKEQIPEFWQADYVVGVTLWGYIYGSTWTTNGNSGIIKNGTDRPAMTWLKEYISTHTNVSSQIDWNNRNGPRFTTPSTLSIEGGTSQVVTLATQATDPVTYAITGGADSAFFSLNGAQLSFKQAPSNANPQDGDKNNVYEVTVSATLAGQTSTLNLKITVTAPQEPFGGSSQMIPGRVEAENYDLGGEGVSFHDADTMNNGNQYRTDAVDITGSDSLGYMIGWTSAGEWLEYTVNVQTAAIYTWTARVSAGLDGGSFRVLLDTTDITGTISVPNGGNWDTYTELTGETPTLPQGSHVLKIEVVGPYFNIDWIEFTTDSTTASLSLDQVISHSGTYQVYNIAGKLLGQFELSLDNSLREQVSSLIPHSGTYFLKNIDQQKVYRISY